MRWLGKLMISFICLPSSVFNVSVYWCHRIRAFAVNHSSGCVCARWPDQRLRFTFVSLVWLCRRRSLMALRVCAYVMCAYAQSAGVCARALISPCVRAYRVSYIISSFFFFVFLSPILRCAASLSTFQPTTHSMRAYKTTFSRSHRHNWRSVFMCARPWFLVCVCVY